MKKLLYLLILPLILLNSSCSMVIKGFGKTLANRYDDQKKTNISDLSLTDKNGKTQKFGELFAGKVVYLYVWKHSELLAPGDENKTYEALKQRFAKYDDVVFINVYTGDKDTDWKLMLDKKNDGVKSYKLSDKPENESFRNLMESSTSAQIIGKDGFILGFKGPSPEDRTIVDYALFHARSGQDAAQSTKNFIKSINSDYRFKNKDTEAWYINQFGKKPEGKVPFTLSSSGSRLSSSESEKSK